MIFFFAKQANSKVTSNDLNENELTNYLSAIISYNNQQNQDSLSYLNSSKALVKKRDNYLRKYIFSLAINQKVKKAIQEIKILENKKDFDFFESQVLLTLDSILKEKYAESENYLEYLNELKGSSVYENAIYDTLTLYLSTFKNKNLIFQKSNFDNLDLLNITFLKCYLDDDTTSKSFYTLVNSSNVDYSRYLFFYSNYLINQNKVEEAKKLFLKQDKISSGLLILQTNDWLKNNQTKKITDIFSCKSEADLLAEFFFLISNLYSSDEDFERSNFYLSISNFLNEKFKANKLLTVENYFNSKKYKEAEKILKNFSKQDKLFYWFKVKIKTKIIAEKYDDKQALNYIETKFNKIENKTDKIIFDMANIYKNYKKYNEAIELYSKLMKNYNINSDTYADLLFRRGGSYERLSNFEKSDKDLLAALKIVPDNSYTLNYLAYSWLERKINISKAVKMLEIAYKNNEDDPYITDSVGWGYYLTGRYTEAEKFMRKAIMLMPDDPIVNDHYGDILWSLNRKIQAKYYWNSVIGFKDTEKDMLEKVKKKLLVGPNIDKNNSYN